MEAMQGHGMFIKRSPAKDTRRSSAEGTAGYLKPHYGIFPVLKLDAPVMASNSFLAHTMLLRLNVVRFHSAQIWTSPREDL